MYEYEDDDYELIEEIQFKKQCSSQSESKIGKIKNYLTNSFYWMGGISIRKDNNIGSEYTVFGQKFYNRQQAIQKMQNTIWITYRNNFPQLIKKKYYSDVGWGCMIRVGQMMLAQALRTHKNKFLSLTNTKQDRLNILGAFLDDDQRNSQFVNYSIQKIVQFAQKDFKLQPGKWLTPSHIAYVLQNLHKKSPLRGYQSMQILVFNNNMLFYQQIINKMGQKKCCCDIVAKKIFCNKCHQNQPQQTNAVLLILLSRIGLDKPSKQHQSSVIALLQMEQSQGIIGGRPNRALYFIGTEGNDKLIYLDPHYVQECTNRQNLEQLKDTFVCKSYRTINYSQIDPSLGFIFYIKNLKQLQKFNQNIQKLTKQNKDFFIYTEFDIPQYIKTNSCKDLQEANNTSKSEEINNDFSFYI